MKVIRPVKIKPEMIVSTTAVNAEPIWATGTPYGKGERRIYDSVRNGPSVYESVIDGNSGNQPDVSPDEWVRVGPTNTWALFDGSASTLSTSENGFECSFRPGGVVDALAFFEVQGVSIQIIVTTDPGDIEVFNRTIDLSNDSMIVDWYTYFFEPFDFIRDGVVFDMPPYGASVTVHIKVTGSGVTGVGEVVVGTITEIGETEHGASHGIRDYSRAKEDDFGNVHLLKGAYAKRGNVQVFVSKARHRYVSRVLADLRAVPTVFIGSDDPDYEPLIIFGFLKNWEGAIPYPTKTLINMDIQGLK